MHIYSGGQTSSTVDAATIINYKPLFDLNFARYTGQYSSYIVLLPLLGLEALACYLLLPLNSYVIAKISHITLTNLFPLILSTNLE